MSLSELIDFDHLHHAYLIEGSRADTLTELLRHLEGSGIAIKGNPDLHLHECDAFLLEDAREIKREQSMHGGEGSRKIFIVAFHTMITEAQNALLKTLEEPTEGTHFFFITRTGEILAETVRSRMFLINVAQEKQSDLAGVSFLTASIPERLKTIEKMTKAKPDDKARAKEEARVFLESIEIALHERFMKEPDTLRRPIQDVLLAKQYLSDRSPSLKLLLEHLALTLPSCSK